MLHAAERQCSVSQSPLSRAGCSRIDSTMGSLIYLSIVAAVAAQRTLIPTTKALEAVEAAKDLARQRRHARNHHVATTLFSDPNTFASRVLKSAGGDAASPACRTQEGAASIAERRQRQCARRVPSWETPARGILREVPGSKGRCAFIDCLIRRRAPQEVHSCWYYY